MARLRDSARVSPTCHAPASAADHIVPLESHYHAHWVAVPGVRRLEAERLQKLQDTDKAKANRSSMPYDPITLMYDDGHDGERLKYYDEKTKVCAAILWLALREFTSDSWCAAGVTQWRAGLRAANMQKHDMSTPYNPITGLPLNRLEVPERPSSPSFHH